MTDPGSGQDQARKLLQSARRHLVDARRKARERPETEHGNATEEAAFLFAQAQAEATVSIAGQLADAAESIDSLAKAIKKLNEPR